MINAVIIEDEKEHGSSSALVKTNCPEINIVSTADSVASGVELVERISAFYTISKFRWKRFDLPERIGNKTMMSSSPPSVRMR